MTAPAATESDGDFSFAKCRPLTKSETLQGFFSLVRPSGLITTQSTTIADGGRKSQDSALAAIHRWFEAQKGESR